MCVERERDYAIFIWFRAIKDNCNWDAAFVTLTLLAFTLLRKAFRKRVG